VVVGRCSPEEGDQKVEEEVYRQEEVVVRQKKLPMEVAQR